MERLGCTRGIIIHGVMGSREEGGAEGETRFTEIENTIVQEVQRILASPEMILIRAAHHTGTSSTVRIGERLIQYEPDLLASGMTMFDDNGFLIGREAFVRLSKLAP